MCASLLLASWCEKRKGKKEKARRQFNEKPSIIPGCPTADVTMLWTLCYCVSSVPVVAFLHWPATDALCWYNMWVHIAWSKLSVAKWGHMQATKQHCLYIQQTEALQRLHALVWAIHVSNASEPLNRRSASSQYMCISVSQTCQQCIRISEL